MAYLIKIDNYNEENFIYVIAENKTELQAVIANLKEDDEVASITPLQGTVYTVSSYIAEAKE